MPHSTSWSPRGVTWTFWGVVTGEEVLRSNREIYADVRFNDIRYEIVDLTRVERFDVTPADMAVLAASDHAVARANPNVRVAVAASDDTIRKLSLYYEAQGSDTAWDQQIFDTLREAEEWAIR